VIYEGGKSRAFGVQTHCVKLTCTCKAHLILRPLRLAHQPSLSHHGHDHGRPADDLGRDAVRKPIPLRSRKCIDKHHGTTRAAPDLPGESPAFFCVPQLPRLCCCVRGARRRQRAGTPHYAKFHRRLVFRCGLHGEMSFRKCVCISSRLHISSFLLHTSSIHGVSRRRGGSTSILFSFFFLFDSIHRIHVTHTK
jgi:hypothetical protein